MSRYLIIVEETATGYSAYSPDLPGCAAARKFCATKTPAMMLTAITSQIIPSVLRSCFVPVLLRDRRVKVRRISETR